MCWPNPSGNQHLEQAEETERDLATDSRKEDAGRQSHLVSVAGECCWGLLLGSVAGECCWGVLLVSFAGEC